MAIHSKVGIVGHALEYPVEHTLFDPAVMAPLGCLTGAKPLRQIAPASARTRQPKDRIEKPTPVTARPAPALAPARHKLAQPFPLIVPKHLAFHTDLQKPALNQNSDQKGNPLNCHHNLIPPQRRSTDGMGTSFALTYSPNALACASKRSVSVAPPSRRPTMTKFTASRLGRG